MKSGISPAMAAHMAGKHTTLARAFKVTRRDSAVFGFTSHQRDITLDGVLYRARTGLSGSALQSAASLTAQNMEVQGGFLSDVVTEEDIYAGLWSFAEVEIFDFNYCDLSMGTVPQSGGVLGEIRAGRGMFFAELWGLGKLLQQPMGRMFLPLCDADLGDARCKVNLAAITNGIVAATVTAVTDQSQFAASALATPAGWSSAGKVTWTSGLNVGISMEVREHAPGGAITLHLPMFRAIQVGDTFQITAGCTKRAIEDCKTKFNNIANHRGFALMPGMDRLVTGA